jgi:hypothetical protein
VKSWVWQVSTILWMSWRAVQASLALRSLIVLLAGRLLTGGRRDGGSLDTECEQELQCTSRKNSGGFIRAIAVYLLSSSTTSKAVADTRQLVIDPLSMRLLQ